MAKRKATVDFEKSLEELESIVELLEEGDLTLEESLTTFEKGINLTKTCQTALADAEQRVKILLEKDGKDTTEDFNVD